MPEKETSQNAAEAVIDLRALELEIDKEIDALLVPAIQRAQRTADGSKTTGEAQSVSPPPKPGRENRESAVTSNPSFDFDDLQAEIEKEIDNLFVPADQWRSREPVQAGSEKRPQATRGIPGASDSKASVVVAPKESGPSPEPIQAAEAQSGKLDGLQAEIDKEIDNLFVPADQWRSREPVQAASEKRPQATRGIPGASDSKASVVVAPKESGPSPEPIRASASSNKYDESLPDNPLYARRSDSHELAGIIEQFNAAYLSVDWELSRDNIKEFLATLNRLEPFASRSTDTKSVLRLMEVILKRLLDRPHAVNSRLVRLIRDSQGLLAHLLLIDGEIGPQEKQQLKDLFARFNELRQRALAAKAEAKKHTVEDIRTQAAAAARDEIRPPRAASPPLFPSATGTDPLHELRDWMDKIGQSISENLKVFDTEIARLRQIENMLRQTPESASIAGRLSGIGKSLESQAGILRDKRGESIEWVSRIAKLETAHAHEKNQPQKPDGAGPAAETRSTGEKADGTACSEDIYLIASDGKCLALPAGCVIRVARSSAGKGVRILKRGYATLGDFRPPLRGIKSGVLGDWAKRPRKELNSYRFEPVEPAVFDRSKTGGQMAVLASDGQKHVVVFAESADFIADAQIAAGAPGMGDFGASETQSALFTLAFDPSNPLPLPDQISSTNSSADGCSRR